VNSSRRSVVAACAGNAVEWYDFAVYGALGVVIAPVFFPARDDTSVLLAAFTVYATAFLVRPLGAFVFGVLADRRGRRAVLVAVVVLMSVATAAVGLLPGYAAIGVLAPCVVLALRATQGLAAGGEMGLVAVFLAEHAPAGRRGMYTSWHIATFAVGVAAGFAVGAVLTRLPESQLSAGWWRVAFLLALPLGVVGVYLRQRVPESPVYVSARREASLQEHPLRELWRGHRRAWGTGFAAVAAGSLAFNTFFVFVPNHLIVAGTHTVSVALLAVVPGLLGAAGVAVGLGALSDRLGRRPVVLASATVLAVGAVPAFAVVTSGSLVGLVLGEVAVGAAVAGVLSVSMLTEMFPTGLRATGAAMTLGLATAIVGGTAPLVDQVLSQVTGQRLAPAAYVALIALIAVLAVRSAPETASLDLTRPHASSTSPPDGSSVVSGPSS
jgi:MHS family proline/betaine transporter-like MFS transporter